MGVSLVAKRNVKPIFAMVALLFGLVTSGCTGTAVGQRGVADAARAGGRGETMYVACGNMPVHAQPTAFSPAIGRVGFGQAYVVIGADGFYLPRNQSQQVPAWARIQYGRTVGYVVARCMVDRGFLASQQQKASAERRRADSQTAAARRGFSEDMQDEELVSVRGAKGKARGGRIRNYRAVDEAVAASTSNDAQAAYRSFRQQGLLGEYFRW